MIKVMSTEVFSAFSGNCRSLYWKVTSYYSEGGNDKVTVCHKVSGSQGKTNTISISKTRYRSIWIMEMHRGLVMAVQILKTSRAEIKLVATIQEVHTSTTNGTGSGNSSSTNQTTTSGSQNTAVTNNSNQNSSTVSNSQTSSSTNTGTQNQTSTSGSNQGSTAGNQGSSGYTNANLSNLQNTGNTVNTTAEPEPTTRKVYGTVKATVHVFNKSLSSRGVLDFKIIDAHNQRVLSQEKMPGEYVWYTEWGYFNGDERALDEYFLEIVKLKEANPPLPQDLFVAFTQPIFGQVTNKIRNFYKGY